jgi:hypothetical protein
VDRLPIKAYPRVFAAIALALALGAPAEAAQVTATARAVTVRPLSMVKTGDLLFGNIIPSALAGSVVVDPDTERATYAGVAGAGGTIQAARFIGAGTPGRMVNVRWTNGAFTLTRVGGGGTMTVDSLRAGSILVMNGSSGIGLIPLDRAFDLRLGGRLLVGANQLDGQYEGTFAITTDYH